MGPAALAQVLRPLRQFSHPDLLVGIDPGDDAAVYRLSADQALVQTVDFFPPVVDDPYTFGAVAAANAMSDVYAMGGRVLLALNVAAFPDDLPPEILTAIFQGGADKVHEAGGVVGGGHTVVDREPKYGLCVTGVVDPARVMTKGGARPGDRLALTKPLGTGALTTAHKQERLAADDLGAAVASMVRLNRAAAEAAVAAGVRAATDVTGFGLLGHALEMAEASGVALRFDAAEVPLLPGALRCAEEGILPGGAWRNRDHLLGTHGEAGARLRLGASVPEALAHLLYDPETSGGLLIAVPPEHLPILEAEMERRGQPCWIVGEALEGAGIDVA